MRRLRLQIIGLLLLVALLPALPAAFTARALLQRSLGAAPEEQVLFGLRAGLAGARDELERDKESFRQRILSGAGLDTLGEAAWARLDAAERRALEALAPGPEDRPAAPGAIEIGPERVQLGGREQLVARVRRRDGSRIWFVMPLPGPLVQRAQSLTESVRLLETMRHDRGWLLRGLLATYLAVYGALLGLVAGLGLLVASRLTRPLAALGEGIDRVAAGALDTRVEAPPGGHLGPLVEQFNRMVRRLKDQQDELVRLEKLAAWRNLARRLAHEIKNPLTPIQLAAQQMRDGYRGDDLEHRRLLADGAGIVEEEVQALRALVQEFSAFARLPAPHPRAVPVADLLGEIQSLYGPAKLRARAAATALIAWCDAEEMHRVLINLVNNALQAQEHLGAGGPVEVVASPETNLDCSPPPPASSPRARAGVVFEVLDRGPGVKAEDRQRVFAPDYSTKPGGMGLGLAIVQDIVRAHGGTIEVSDRPGGGAAFRFSLPAPPAAE